jgi:hypothetical protein
VRGQFATLKTLAPLLVSDHLRIDVICLDCGVLIAVLRYLSIISIVDVRN